MPEIPITAIDRLIRRDQQDIRVSPEATVQLREILEDFSQKIVNKAVELMVKSSGRKTLTAEDIKLAFQLVQEKF